MLCGIKKLRYKNERPFNQHYKSLKVSRSLLLNTNNDWKEPVVIHNEICEDKLKPGGFRFGEDM